MNNPELTQLLDRIATALERLAPLGDYAQTMLIQARGEKVWEVGGWVLATTSKGDDCAYLYASHPGLKFRVSTVYVERFGDMPFDPYSAAKKYDGEAPPTKEGAMTRGLYNECPPFKISTLPTGKVNDDGDPEHRFNRVLDAPSPTNGTKSPQHSASSAPAAANAPGNGNKPHPALTVLGEVERLAQIKAVRFPGVAKPEHYVFLKQAVGDSIPDRNDQRNVLAYLLNTSPQTVANPDWLPNAARCAAVLDYVSLKTEDGRPVIPLQVSPGRERVFVLIDQMAKESPKF